MKKALIIILLAVVSVGVFAQEAAPQKKPALRQDQLMLDFNWGGLTATPSEVNLGAASWGFSLKTMLDNPVPKSNVSFAVGIGLGIHNYYTNSNIITNNLGTDSSFSSFSVIPDSISYKRNKLTMTYFDIPAEIRYRSKPNEKGYSWKVAVGGQIGYLLSTKTKVIQDSKKYKTFNYPNMEKWRVGLNARVGYGKVSINGFYSLSSIFEENKGSKYNPFTIGITLMPF